MQNNPVLWKRMSENQTILRLFCISSYILSVSKYLRNTIIC